MGKAEIVTVAGVRNVRAWAGELTWAWINGKPEGADTNFYSYCVDLLNNEQDPQYDVTVKSTDGLDTLGMVTTPFAAQKAAWLFNTYASDAHSAYGGALAAGLQLAIWEVLFDDGRARVTTPAWESFLCNRGVGGGSCRRQWLPGGARGGRLELSDGERHVGSTCL
jgi:hypothetical protein